MTRAELLVAAVALFGLRPSAEQIRQLAQLAAVLALAVEDERDYLRGNAPFSRMPWG